MVSIKIRKKNSYLLLELLIGIFLLSLFLTPMIQAPYSYIKKCKQEALRVRMGLEADKMLIHIEEQMRNGTISWDKIVESQKEKTFLETEPFIEKIQSRAFLCKGKVKKMESGPWIGTVRATVEFYRKDRPKEVIYTLSSLFFVARKKWSPSPSSPLPGDENRICMEFP